MSDKGPIPSGLRLTPLDPVFRERPHEYLDRLRVEAPAHRDTELGRLFFTRFEDVKAIVGNRKLYVDPRKAPPGSYHRRVVGAAKSERQPSMLSLDDPDHRRIRGLVSQAFNQRSVEAFRPRIRAIAGGLLDAVAGRESFDLIADYAAPLPTIVIAEMLGVDPAEQAQFKQWSDALVFSFNPRRTAEQDAELHTASDALDAFFENQIARRRDQRRSDLIGAMVAAEEEGARLTAEEIITTCKLLLVTGNVTTTDLIGNAVFALLRHPDQLALLRRQPELIRNAVEEVLRWDPPVAQSSRLALDEMEIGGTTVHPGESLATSLLSAGRDPAVHAEPHRFDIQRADTSHFAFGGGAHFCLGAPLARAEAQIALDVLLERCPELALDPAHSVEHKRAPAFNGLAELWVRVR